MKKQVTDKPNTSKRRCTYTKYKRKVVKVIRNPSILIPYLKKKFQGSAGRLHKDAIQILKQETSDGTEYLSSPNGVDPVHVFFAKEDALKDMVEVVIIRFNNKKVEDKAIAKVKKHTKHPYKLTVYDNYLKNEGLSTVWNRFIEESKCKYVCLLNSDAFVRKAWLEGMLKGFNLDKVAGISPSSNNAKKQICKSNEIIQNTFLEMSTLSGFCLLVKQDLPFKFPEEVPFYGGEHAWCIEARRYGYKLLWSQGVWVEHLDASSAKKEGNHKEILGNRNQQFFSWLANTTPILFTTYNRLEFTKIALPALLNSICGNVVVIDNNSSDGTKEYLESLDNRKLKIIYHKNNSGISGAMNTFFDMTKNEEFVAKVDNDTIVPEDWLIEMIKLCTQHKIDAMQAKHPVISRKYATFDEWIEKLPRVGKHVFMSDFIGGSGLVIRRDKIKSDMPNIEWVLGGWAEYQKKHPTLRTAFCNNVEIKLLDMDGENNLNYEKYEKYYKETKRYHWHDQKK